MQAEQIMAFTCGMSGEKRNISSEGGRPSGIISDQPTPRSAGTLLSLSENKVMFQGFEEA